MNELMLSPAGLCFISTCVCNVSMYVFGVGWGPGLAGGGGALLCVRYWFLISGLRSKHLSMLYMVPVQLRILFTPPATPALLKVNYVQM